MKSWWVCARKGDLVMVRMALFWSKVSLFKADGDAIVKMFVQYRKCGWMRAKYRLFRALLVRNLFDLFMQ
jgi:hypothetical protein